MDPQRHSIPEKPTFLLQTGQRFFFFPEGALEVVVVDEEAVFVSVVFNSFSIVLVESVMGIFTAEGRVDESETGGAGTEIAEDEEEEVVVVVAVVVEEEEEEDDALDVVAVLWVLFALFIVSL